MKTRPVKGAISQMENKPDTQSGIEVKAANLGAAHRLIELG